MLIFHVIDGLRQVVNYYVENLLYYQNRFSCRRSFQRKSS